MGRHDGRTLNAHRNLSAVLPPGLSSDASGSTPKRWGAHAFSAVAGGRWSKRTVWLLRQDKLSINAAELIAAASVVLLIEADGVIPDNRQFIMKCDNNSACAAVNHGVTTSAGMRVALRIWRRLSMRLKIQVRLLYIETGKNKIAEALSRTDWDRALREVGEVGWECRKRDLSQIIGAWK